MAPAPAHRSPYQSPYPSSPSCAGCSLSTDLAALQCPEPLACAPAVSDELTEQCTDQCVVIACTDPEHESICGKTGPHTQCEFVCDETVGCAGCDGFDAFLQCQDYKTYDTDLSRQTSMAGGTQAVSAWETAFAEWCAACAEMGNTQEVTKASDKSPDGREHAAINTNMQAGSSQSAFGVDSFSQRPSHSASSSATCACMWAGCNALFHSLSELVGHVNLVHLTSSSTSLAATKNAFPDNISHSDNDNSISCLWDNCGSSYYSSSNNFELLADHLMNEHLSTRPVFNSQLQLYQQNQRPHSHSHHQQNQQPHPHSHHQHNQQPHPHPHSHQHQNQSQHNAYEQKFIEQMEDMASSSRQVSQQEQHQHQHLHQLQHEQQDRNYQAHQHQHHDHPHPQEHHNENRPSPPPQSDEEKYPFFRVYVQNMLELDRFVTCEEVVHRMVEGSSRPGQSQIPNYPHEQVNTTNPPDSIQPQPMRMPSPPSTTSFSSESDQETRLEEPLSQITAPSNHSCNGAHDCRWKGCNLTFHSCDDLTTHINDVHIGAGKAHYECFWDQCTRNGPQSFQSKQKICRHVQSHTGHRPFQCSICQQNFSEAATLQQHIRRHTQEKPYGCDFPGCGKSFAITGALTIHKRTHNGDKPFKCTYCERCFAESSNLSKHLRTHTGARPYVCTEPGCTKAFARPDQLNRHKGVHRKQLRGVGQVTDE